MISEVNNLISGSVVKTAEFDACRKVIGVANANLIPNAAGIIPLAKQNGFIVEQNNTDVMETLDTALNPIVNDETLNNLEELNLPLIDPSPTVNNNVVQNQVNEAPKSIFTSELDMQIPTPRESDVIVDSPVQVDSLDSLTSLSSTENEETNVVEQNNVDITPDKNVIMDLQMPQMPTEVVANEPGVVSNSLFEDVQGELPSLDNPILPNSSDVPTAPVMPTIPDNGLTPSLPTESAELPELTELTVNEPVNAKIETKEDQNKTLEIIDIDKIIEEKKKNIIDKVNELSAEINKCFDELKVILNVDEKSNDKTNEKITEKINELPALSEDNLLVNEALNQINNMIIPMDNGISR